MKPATAAHLLYSDRSQVPPIADRSTQEPIGRFGAARAYQRVQCLTVSCEAIDDSHTNRLRKLFCPIRSFI